MIKGFIFITRMDTYPWWTCWWSRKGSSSTQPKKMEKRLSGWPARLYEELIHRFWWIQFIHSMTNMYLMIDNMLINLFLFQHIHTYKIHTYSVSSYLKVLYSYKVQMNYLFLSIFSRYTCKGGYSTFSNLYHTLD